MLAVDTGRGNRHNSGLQRSLTILFLTVEAAPFQVVALAGREADFIYHIMKKRMGHACRS